MTGVCDTHTHTHRSSSLVLWWKGLLSVTFLPTPTWSLPTIAEKGHLPVSIHPSTPHPSSNPPPDTHSNNTHQYHVMRYGNEMNQYQQYRGFGSWVPCQPWKYSKWLYVTFFMVGMVPRLSHGVSIYIWIFKELVIHKHSHEVNHVSLWRTLAVVFQLQQLNNCQTDS